MLKILTHPYGLIKYDAVLWEFIKQTILYPLENYRTSLAQRRLSRLLMLKVAVY